MNRSVVGCSVLGISSTWGLLQHVELQERKNSCAVATTGNSSLSSLLRLDLTLQFVFCILVCLSLLLVIGHRLRPFVGVGIGNRRLEVLLQVTLVPVYGAMRDGPESALTTLLHSRRAIADLLLQALKKVSPQCQRIKPSPVLAGRKGHLFVTTDVHSDRGPVDVLPLDGDLVEQTEVLLGCPLNFLGGTRWSSLLASLDCGLLVFTG